MYIVHQILTRIKVTKIKALTNKILTENKHFKRKINLWALKVTFQTVTFADRSLIGQRTAQKSNTTYDYVKPKVKINVLLFSKIQFNHFFQSI